MVAFFTSCLIIKQRAKSSILELKALSLPSSTLQTSTALANIQSWLRISYIIQGRGVSYQPEWLGPTFEAITQIINLASLPDKEIISSCQDCSSNINSNLRIASETAHRGKVKEKAYERILELQLKFKSDRSQLIKQHSLLAKDFADLIGNIPEYQQKGESEIIYYSDGPFQWLPRLDNSIRSESSDGVRAVEGLSNKIEILRTQSKTIVQNYLAADSKLEKGVIGIATLEREIFDFRLKIKRLLLDAVTEELNPY